MIFEYLIVKLLYEQSEILIQNIISEICVAIPIQITKLQLVQYNTLFSNTK